MSALIEAFSSAGRVPPSIETWLIGMWPAASPATRASIAYTLGRVGGPASLAFLRPHGEYRGSDVVRETARPAIGLLERRGG
jgi:hypothetical protein